MRVEEEERRRPREGKGVEGNERPATDVREEVEGLQRGYRAG